jgi:hypothetical protein
MNKGIEKQNGIKNLTEKDANADENQTIEWETKH